MKDFDFLTENNISHGDSQTHCRANSKYKSGRLVMYYFGRVLFLQYLFFSNGIFTF